MIVNKTSQLISMAAAGIIVGLSVSGCTKTSQPTANTQNPKLALADQKTMVDAISSAKLWSATEINGIVTVTNEGGKTISYSTTSGIQLIEQDGFAFKDLNKNGILDPYEDWRLTAEERAINLASLMSLDQIAGLMLYSSHQKIPGGTAYGTTPDTYDQKDYEDSQANAWDLSDSQKRFLTDDNLRHVLITAVDSPLVAAKWNNEAQAFVEGQGLGIPINTSSDPRNGADNNSEYTAGAGGNISQWPDSLGLAATFDPSLVEEYGQIASAEYRALGIATALSPQIDLATDPRWYRFVGTFGEDSSLAIDMARAYVDGFQTSTGEFALDGVWGLHSVNAMVKHWPGGGSGESGRDAHYGFGKFAVYPGNNFDEHLLPFTKGAFQLKGGTSMASAVMPYYTISYQQDTVNQENVGNGFSEYIINDLLRGTYHYDGVICTDWGITKDYVGLNKFGRTCWGTETLSSAEKHYKILMAGVDQFGGNNDMKPILEAYQIGVKEHGEEFMNSRFQESARRLLINIFNTGLFENPYLDPEVSAQTVGKAEFMEKGYQAQLKSIVMLKNNNNFIAETTNSEKLTVYVPSLFSPATINWVGAETAESISDPISKDILEQYYHIAKTPEEADFALVFMTSPQTGNVALESRNVGYSAFDAEQGGNGFIPISLQYTPYTATAARETSIASDPAIDQIDNRSYLGKTVVASNEKQFTTLVETRAKMGDKPVVVSISTATPIVLAEVEPLADVILIDFGTQRQAILDIISGKVEPSALLPAQMPLNMDTVEKQLEDVAHDMECYTDSIGNTYDFAYGLNWGGVIADERTNAYQK